MKVAGSIAASAAPSGRLAGADLGLYAVTVLVWGTSWIAMKGQLGEVSPEVSTFWRFLLAAPLMWLWAAAKGERLAWPLADHLRFAASGALLFWPEFSRTGLGGGALIGLSLALCGTLSFCLGNLAATLAQRRGVPMLAATAWGMTYGVAVLGLIGLA